MERAVLIGIITPEISHDSSKDYLEELAFLTKTAGADPIKTFTQKLNHPDHKTFLGKGKIQVFNSKDYDECCMKVLRKNPLAFVENYSKK